MVGFFRIKLQCENFSGKNIFYKKFAVVCEFFIYLKNTSNIQSNQKQRFQQKIPLLPSCGIFLCLYNTPFNSLIKTMINFDLLI
jgi:hypothetical protein